MSSGRVHIVGAGLAGLGCAVALAEAGVPVDLHEAAAHGGGRCRSYHDAYLDRLIDNGNHLLLSGNRAAKRYIDRIGSRAEFDIPARAAFPFLDLRDGRRWTVRPNAGPLPWWVIRPSRRVPGTRIFDYLAGLRLIGAGDKVVTDCLDPTAALYRRFWEPLALAALNTPLDQALARLLLPVLRETFLRGEAGCRPMIAKHGLSLSLVDPAIEFIRAHGGTIRFNHRLTGLSRGDRVTALHFGDGDIALGQDDRLVLALPCWALGKLIDDIALPQETHAIVNAHFAVDAPPPEEAALLGLIGGAAHWLFFRPGLVSVTVSAGDDLAELPAEAVAATLWPDIAAATGLDPTTLPRYRIVKEKRATFAQTPAAEKLRPGTRTKWRNLLLAGDWTATGLPATIEGALRSGFAAAAALLKE